LGDGSLLTDERNRALGQESVNTQVNLRLPAELLAQVDEARGDVPRERWIRRAVEAALRQEAVEQDRRRV